MVRLIFGYADRIFHRRANEEKPRFQSREGIFWATKIRGS
jgi:hypothetical protein